jgi:transcriptional regulator with XRE-family HTH domain
MEFSEKVRGLLKAHRMSQHDLAKALGTSQQQVSRWLEANAPPKPAGHLLRMARTLEVTADFLIDPEQEQPQPSGLSKDDEMILRLARILGFNEAISRLMAAPSGVAGVTSRNPEAPRRADDGASRSGVKHQSG